MFFDTTRFISLIFLSTIASIAHSQRDPEIVTRKWWNDSKYTPEISEGARHIRMGSSGYFFEANNGIAGIPNCDINLLYYSRSGSAIPEKELEECATIEYNIHRVVTGEQINIENVFEKRQMLDRFSNIILNRLETFKSSDSFYFRSSNFLIGPYNFNESSFPVNFLFGTSFDHKRKTYSFDGPRLKNNSYSGGFLSDENMAREIETSRASKNILYASNKVYFKVNDVKETPDGEKKILINIIKYEFSYLGDRSKRHTLTVNSRP